MSWYILLLAGLFEVGWAIGLKYTEGFTRLWPTLGTVAAMAVSLALLGIAMKSLPVGTAYAAWVAPEVTLVIPRDAQGRSTAPSSLVADAHAAGLKVVVWTVRAENFFLPLEHRSGALPAAHGDMAGYVHALSETGVDAIFSDFPALAREGLR